MGLDTLRESIVLAKLVNRDYEREITGLKVGATVAVAVPAAIATRAVVPDVVPPPVTAVTPTSVNVTVDQWRDAPFAMDDKALAQVQRGIIPMQLAEAAKALANYIDSYLWSLTHDANGFYGYVGTAGTTPLQVDFGDYLSARAVANRQLMPRDPRYMIVDVDAEANVLNLRGAQDASWAASNSVIVDGMIGRKLGANWAMSQNVPTHTSGTITTGLIAKAATAVAVGVKTVVCTTAASTGACALLPGDIITFSNQTQTYIVTAAATQASAATDVTVTIEPGLKVALAGSEVVSVKGSHVVNLLVNRDAIAFAMAPLMDVAMTASRRANIAVAIDEESGLALRLEISDQYKQTQWSLDALWGGKVVRREGGVRLAG